MAGPASHESNEFTSSSRRHGVLALAVAAALATGPGAAAEAVHAGDAVLRPVPEAWFEPAPTLETDFAGDPVDEPGTAASPADSRVQSAWAHQADYLERWLRTEGFRLGDRVHLRIYKASRELEVHLLRDGRYEHFRTFRICAISGELGPKQREGDRQAPEGVYQVTRDRMHPASEFHLAFNLGFPNPRDLARGATGSNIMIHGGCASTGCFAMTDYYMEQLWVLTEAAFDAGQAAVDVHVFPFRMTDENLQLHAASRHREFWDTLVPVARYFDVHGHPPLIADHGPDYRVLGAAALEASQTSAP